MLSLTALIQSLPTNYIKLLFDVALLPKTHAAGGEADIVYEYPKSVVYPAHSLLLEATLSDRTNQRRMEMEPVRNKRQCKNVCS